MPRLPVYDQPQVQANPLAAPGQGMMKSNAAEVLGYAGQAAQIALQEKEKADTYRAEDAFNQLQEQKTQLWSEASQKQGANAFNVHDDYTKKYDEKADEIAETLGSSSAFKFKQAAARGRLAFGAELEHHQSQQVEANTQNILELGHKQDIDEAGSTVLPEVADQRAKHTAFLAGAYADNRGIKDDPAKGVMARQEYIKAATSNVHLSYLSSALKRSPAEAEDYLLKHQGEMTGADIQKVRDHIAVASAFDLGQAVALENIQAHLGEDGKKDGIPETKIISTILQDPRLKGNEQAKQHAIAIAKMMISTQKQDWEAETDKTVTAVLDVSNRQGPWAALRSGSYTELMLKDPTRANKTRDHLLAEADAAKSRANAEPTDPKQIAKRGFLFNDLLAQARAGTLTQEAVIAKSPELGKQGAASLVHAIGEMQRSPAKSHQYTVDHDLLTSSLRRAGAIGDKLDDSDKALVGDLHAKIMLRQSASQVDWSQENTQKLIDSEIQPIITDPSNHWWTSENKAPAFKVEDQVPAKFTQLALGRNPSLSRNAITQAYFLAKSQGLLNEDGSYKVNP